MIDVDELAREALLPPPTGCPDSVRRRKAAFLEDICSGRRRQRRLRIVVLRRIAMPVFVVVLTAAVLLPQLLSPSIAAATVLRTASSSALARPPVTLAPGQYLYTEYRSLNEVLAVSGGAGANSDHAEAVATATFEQTLQVWTDRSGSGQYTVDRGALKFSSPADEANWQQSAVAQGWEESHFKAQEIGTAVQDVTTNVATLPTDPKTLMAQISAGKTGTAVDHIPAGPDSMFERAASLLVNPSVGMTPALQAALYQVLAIQPGVTATSGVTAQSGAKGTAVSVDDASPGTIDRLVIDPHSGTPLEADAAPYSTVNPIPTPSGSAAACSTSACSSIQPPTETVALIALWKAPSQPVVVNSDTSTTPAGS